LPGCLCLRDGTGWAENVADVGGGDAVARAGGAVRPSTIVAFQECFHLKHRGRGTVFSWRGPWGQRSVLPARTGNPPGNLGVRAGPTGWAVAGQTRNAAIMAADLVLI